MSSHDEFASDVDAYLQAQRQVVESQEQDQQQQYYNGERYLYNQDTDQWYDTLMGEYLRYDETLQTYIPITPPPAAGTSPTTMDDEQQEEEQEGDQQTTTLLIETMYLVVLESNRLTAGQVILVDTKGLTVGRDRSWEEQHLRLAELPVSKYHCQIYYNEDDHQFHVIDFGSRNGTFLNQQRLSGTKSSSVPAPLNDLDQLQIGSTLFQVHKHKQPCQQCLLRDQNRVDLSDGTRKDGMVGKEQQQQHPSMTLSTHSDLGSSEMKEKEWMQELRRLKRSYAPVVEKKSDYVDAAERRRQLYASTTTPSYLKKPHVDGDNDDEKQVETTERATTQTPVQGIGNTMLRKMGWQEGQSLGRIGAEGITAPIAPLTQTHRAGLGSSSSMQDATTKASSKQLKRLEITKQRYYKKG